MITFHSWTTWWIASLIIILPDCNCHLILDPDSVVVLPAAAAHVVVDGELDREVLVRLPGIVVDDLHPDLELSNAWVEGDQFVNGHIVLARDGRAIHSAHYDLDSVLGAAKPDQRDGEPARVLVDRYLVILELHGPSSNRNTYSILASLSISTLVIICALRNTFSTIRITS